MKNDLNKNKVVLGLSGGVDSTAAALLLKEKGLHVTGLYFDVLGTNKSGRESAEKVAAEAGIDFIYKDVSKKFADIVIDNFCNEYLHGRTPNPCVLCNPTVKFASLIEEADRIGAYYVATGHYADKYIDQDTGICYISVAANEKKDQSYMMYRLKQDVLSRLLLPLAGFASKDETRSLVRENELKNADLKDSQEICFLPADEDYVDYIKKKTDFIIKKGNFIDKNGRILGQHRGIVNYTLGQRKGLGIALGKPAFVTRLDCELNTVTLGENEELFSKTVYADNCVFTETGDGILPERLETAKLTAKIRYAAKRADVVLHRQSDDTVEAVFTEPQRAATPGQSIVFYEDNKVVGGGIIK